MGTPGPIPRQLAGAPFLGSAAVAAGLVTRKRLLGPSFLRVLHGVYISRGVAMDHGVRCRAAALLLPETHALSGGSAAWCYGIRLAATSHSVIASTSGAVHVEGAQGIRVGSRHSGSYTPPDSAIRHPRRWKIHRASRSRLAGGQGRRGVRRKSSCRRRTDAPGPPATERPGARRVDRRPRKRCLVRRVWLAGSRPALPGTPRCSDTAVRG